MTQYYYSDQLMTIPLINSDHHGNLSIPNHHTTMYATVEPLYAEPPWDKWNPSIRTTTGTVNDYSVI